MADTGKKIAVEEDIWDIITSLPSNVITHILDFLPVEDLARTSILSRNWRYIWASHPNVKIHFDSLEINNRKTSSDIINKILLQHIGPVLKFSLVLDPPNDFDYSFLDHWILYLSRNGIKELTLDCSFTAEGCCTLPSHIFSSPELLVLNLFNIFFKPPNVHAYFRKLTILNFSSIDFGSSKLTSAINAPQLTHLTFIYCLGFRYFKICAPKLKTLAIDECHDVELSGFEMPEITTLALTDCVSYKTSLTGLFEKWRLISCFHVDGRSLKFLVGDTTHLERLPLMAGSLKHLVIKDIYGADLDCISCTIHLLKSSTTLSRLEISVATFPSGWDVTDETIEVLEYLDATHNMKWTTNSLEVVIIDGTCGSEIEMRLIKLLLSRAPILKKMFVKSISNENTSIKLSERLMRLPQASTEANIIFESNIRVAVLPRFQRFTL